MVWVNRSTFLRLEDLYDHGYNNKHAAKVVGQSWLKETMMMTTDVRWETVVSHFIVLYLMNLCIYLNHRLDSVDEFCCSLNYIT